MLRTVATALVFFKSTFKLSCLLQPRNKQEKIILDFIAPLICIQGYKPVSCLLILIVRFGRCTTILGSKLLRLCFYARTFKYLLRFAVASRFFM